MPIVLIVTGTCGSGKTTVSNLLARRAGWARVSEDDIWSAHFGRDRGTFGSEEHRRKRLVDTSEETPEQTVRRLLDAVAA